MSEIVVPERSVAAGESALPVKPRRPKRVRVRRSVWVTISVAAAVLVAIAVLVLLRREAPPEPARILPEADAIVYLNLRPVRLARYLAKHPVTPEADFAAFEGATGIQLERDMDEAAFAIHVLPSPLSSQGPVGFSEVFTGHFDAARLGGYLQSLASGTEQYNTKTIYIIPHDGRTVRVAILAYDTVAASNMPTTEQIHHMVDAYRTSALPFNGPTLLRENYRDVPLLSFAWAIGRIGPPLSENHRVTVFGIPIPVPDGTTIVASARVLNAIHLRVEGITPTETDAVWAARGLGTLLTVVRTSNWAFGSKDSDFSSLVSSSEVEQKNNRVVVTLSVPPSMAQRLFEPAK